LIKNYKEFPKRLSKKNVFRKYVNSEKCCVKIRSSDKSHGTNFVIVVIGVVIKVLVVIEVAIVVVFIVVYL
jgi:hypothetical protein